MATTKATKAAAVTLPETTAAEPAVPAEVVKRPVFRDKEFTSRTLILPNKRTVQVVGGVVEATDPELLTFLRTRSSFELVTE